MQSLKKIKQINDEADSCSNVLRLSMDAKDRVKIGDFSRGGSSYANVTANDHDFGGEYYATRNPITKIQRSENVFYMFKNHS